MGAVLQFVVTEARPARSVEAASSMPPGQGYGGEVVIFPGVRYERSAGEASRAVSHTRRAGPRERDRLELID